MDDKMVFEIPEMEIVRFSKDNIFCTAITLSVNNTNDTTGWSTYFGGDSTSSDA